MAQRLIRTIVGGFAVAGMLFASAAPTLSVYADPPDGTGKPVTPAAGPANGGGASNDGGNQGGGNAARPSDPTITQSGPDAGDNQHPSGRDRSVEPGGLPQGNSGSNPDENTRGPERTSTGGPDKPGHGGGVDKQDQDGNNGCGNDDDFEDDNEGWCGGRPQPNTNPVTNNPGPGTITTTTTTNNTSATTTTTTTNQVNTTSGGGSGNASSGGGNNQFTAENGPTGGASAQVPQVGGAAGVVPQNGIIQERIFIPSLRPAPEQPQPIAEPVGGGVAALHLEEMPDEVGGALGAMEEEVVPVFVTPAQLPQTGDVLPMAGQAALAFGTLLVGAGALMRRMRR